jgi:Fe-S oxidoreductase
MQVNAREFAVDHGLFACIQCGKCTGGCPVGYKTALNIRAVIYGLLVSDNGFDLAGFDELWDCTTCNTCTSRCPKEVDPMEVMIALRSQVVESGRIPNTVKVALQSVFTQGNPLTFSREDRAAWADTEVPILSDIKRPVEYLYFVGCTPSYDPRIQRVAKTLVRVFNQAHLDFGILGQEENCCGSEVRRLGEAGLFEMLVEENLELWDAYQVKRVVTTSPHCFNALKRDYPGGRLDVVHYTELLSQLLVDGQLAFNGRLNKTVTYHDPCYLGKHNQIFEAPRAILQAIPGLEFVEMDRNRERSLCCEGGGGRMWLEGTNIEERLAHQRIQEALDCGAEVIATACPFCVLTLEDAAKMRGLEDQIQVVDITELIAQVM